MLKSISLLTLDASGDWAATASAPNLPDGTTTFTEAVPPKVPINGQRDKFDSSFTGWFAKSEIDT